MDIGKLIELHDSGALNIDFEKDGETASLGNMMITKEQAKILCTNLGWTSFVLSPFDIIAKTNKFIRGLKNNMGRDEWKDVEIDFQNNRSNTYGKTFDRIHMTYKRDFEVSVLYGMEGNGAPYVIYDSKTSVPLEKCRNLKKVAEYIDTLFD